MGCCCSRAKKKAARHAVLIGAHLLFVAVLVAVSCAVNPLTAIGVVPSLIQVVDSAYALSRSSSRFSTPRLYEDVKYETEYNGHDHVPVSPPSTHEPARRGHGGHGGGDPTPSPCLRPRP